MRRPLLVIAGALLLQFSALSIAQADVYPSTSDSSSTSSSTTTSTTSTTSTSTTSTSTSTTTSTTRPPTSTEEPTSSTREEPEFGLMRISPTSGRPGTVISVNSITPSPLEGEQVAFVGLFPVNSDSPLTVVSLDVAADGSWGGSLVVPRDTEPGDYVVFAQTVLTSALEVDASATAFPYAAVPFEVTPAPNRPGIRPPSGPAPSAPPVARSPSLTG